MEEAMLSPAADRMTIPAQMFADLGKSSMAYVKPQICGPETVTYAIHAADGTFLWECADRAVACATLRAHDIEPLSVH
jgi:hypothetical protein